MNEISEFDDLVDVLVPFDLQSSVCRVLVSTIPPSSTVVTQPLTTEATTHIITTTPVLTTTPALTMISSVATTSAVASQTTTDPTATPVMTTTFGLYLN